MGLLAGGGSEWKVGDEMKWKKVVILILNFLISRASCRGMGSRAVIRWAKNSAVLHDASYYSPIQLEGLAVSILFQIIFELS